MKADAVWVNRDLRITGGEEGELLGARHDREPIGDHVAEAVHQAPLLGRLAVEQRDLLGILAHAHEVEAEVRLVALLIEVEPDQRPPDQMRDHGAHRRVDHRRPHQIAGNTPFDPEHGERRALGQHPQDGEERAERDHSPQEADDDRQGPLDEHLDVFGDALVGIVGGVAEQLHAVVVGAVEPVGEVADRHPAAPANLQPLIEIELVDGEHDVGGGEHAEEQQLADEAVPVAILDGVEEPRVPLIEQHVDADDGELDRDHRGQQNAARPGILGEEIGRGKPPNGGERRDEAFHGRSPVMVGGRRDGRPRLGASG